jgi:hypothetical protein
MATDDCPLSLMSRSPDPGRLLDGVSIDMPRPHKVIGEDFERYRASFVERLRSEITKTFQAQELAERLDTRIKSTRRRMVCHHP